MQGEHAAAIAELGWFGAHKYLLLRRAVQFGLLGLFALGPLLGIWLFKEIYRPVYCSIPFPLPIHW